MNIENIYKLLLVSVQLIRIRLLLKRRRQIRRRWWTRPHIYPEIRQQYGAYDQLFKYFKISDHGQFFDFTRLSVQQFDMLHNIVAPKLLKRSRRKPLSTEFRLAVTLSYSFLAHGDSISTTSWYFRIGKSTIYKIIPEVCKAIWEILQPLYMKCPETAEEWTKIADDFYDMWQFPNCIGAVDGKHCRIKAPPNSGSAFHNYKGYFSLVLMAIADARYRFIWVDIGDYGSLNDAGIWSNTVMSGALEKNSLSIPQARSLPNSDVVVPFSLVGDEGFPLKTYLMRPYARKNLVGNEQRVFNYRLSRARRVVENAFGILVARWRVLHTPLAMKIQNAEAIIQATTCLHNFCMTTSPNKYLHDGIADRVLPNGDIIDGQFRNNITGNHCIQRIGRVGTNTSAVTAMRQRDKLGKYVISEQGSVPWQWKYI